jgi:hypothetical protein
MFDKCDELILIHIDSAGINRWKERNSDLCASLMLLTSRGG